MTSVGVVLSYCLGASLAWNWLCLASCLADLLPLLPPREPALAGLQWRGGPRLQVNALDQVKLARCDSNSSSVLVIVILHIMHLDVTHL